MEKKYYFRGLGLGIIVTALIMGIAVSRGEKREMTDAEIIAKAKQLGMTENTRLLEPSEDGESQEGAPADKEEPTGEPEPSAKSGAGTETTAADAASNQAASDAAQPERPAQDQKPAATTNEMTKQDDDAGQDAPEAKEPSNQTAPAAREPSNQTASASSITIVSGDGSYTVAKKLEAAGVVTSASLYDDFLCRNGYDKRLRTGTFQIPAGASDDEIAKIVTNQP